MVRESKHTPGPWWTAAEYDGEEMGCAIIAARTDCGPLPGNPSRGMVAWASAILEKDARRCEADARLIAAAPDLLEACKAMIAFIEGDEGQEPPFNGIRAAIAKATGTALRDKAEREDGNAHQ